MVQACGNGQNIEVSASGRSILIPQDSEEEARADAVPVRENVLLDEGGEISTDLK